jgi:glycosyltransferase involved in cell wall biosynthesis
MHEPYKEDKSQYKRKALAITAMEYVQEKLLPLIDVVILHSRRGNNAFRIRYPDFKGVVKLIPLGYRDECKMKQHESRIYDITFFGGAVKAKGIDDFFEFLKKSQELNSGLKFQLVTPSRIDRYLSRLGPNWEKWLKVVNKPTISDEEIREACAKTYAVIASYRETTQSGAIPVAFMNGTPVIATDIEGLYEYITDKVNGVYIPKNFSYSDVVSALNYIKANFSEMSKNARKSFVEIWSDGNWDKYYGWLVEMLNCKT